MHDQVRVAVVGEAHDLRLGSPVEAAALARRLAEVVDRDHDRGVPRVDGTAHEVLVIGGILHRVDLHPERARTLRPDLLDRRARVVADDHHRVALIRCLRGAKLAVGMCAPLVAGGRDQDRHAHPLAEQLHREADLARVAHHSRAQLPVLEGADVLLVSQPNRVPGGAEEELEALRRHVLPGDRFEVGDRQAFDVSESSHHTVHSAGACTSDRSIWAERGDAGQRHHPIDLRVKDVEDASRPRLAGGAEPPPVGPRDGDRARSQPERLDDVGPAPDATVEQDLGPVAHGVGNARQSLDRGAGAVELTAAVVGHPDRVDATLHAALRVGHRHHALDRERLVPDPAQPLEVLPGLRRVEQLPVGVLDQPRSRISTGSRDASQAAMDLGPPARHAVQPRRMQRRVDRCSRRDSDRHREPVAQITLALAVDGDVDRQDGRAEARGLGPLQQFARHAAVLPQVDLKPQGPGSRGRDVLQRVAAVDAEHVDRTGGAGRPSERQLAVGMDQRGQAGRPEHDRRPDGRPEDGGREIAPPDVHQVVRLDHDRVKRRSVTRERHLVLGTTGNEVGNHLRRPSLRLATQVVDRVGAAQLARGHGPRACSGRASMPGIGARNDVSTSRRAIRHSPS